MNAVCLKFKNPSYFPIFKPNLNSQISAFLACFSKSINPDSDTIDYHISVNYVINKNKTKNLQRSNSKTKQ